MNPNTPSNDRYVTIFESELGYLAGEARSMGRIETGGALYGLRDNQGMPVIYLAGQAGPGAIQEADYFQQELQWFVESTELVWNEFAVGLQGQWHSHHCLGLSSPSSRDLASISSIVRKNALDCFLQFIVTFDEPAGFSQVDSGNSLYPYYCRHSVRPLSKPERVRIDAHVLLGPTAANMTTVPLFVMPGLSPLRKAAGYLPSATHPVKFTVKPLSMDQITCLKVETQDEEEDIPEEIESALLSLPEEVLMQTIIARKNDKIHCDLPLCSGRKLRLLYSADTNPALLAAGVCHNAEGETKTIRRLQIQGDESVNELLADAQRQVKGTHGHDESAKPNQYQPIRKGKERSDPYSDESPKLTNKDDR